MEFWGEEKKYPAQLEEALQGEIGYSLTAGGLTAAHGYAVTK